MVDGQGGLEEWSDERWVEDMRDDGSGDWRMSQVAEEMYSKTRRKKKKQVGLLPMIFHEKPTFKCVDNNSVMKKT